MVWRKPHSQHSSPRENQNSNSALANWVYKSEKNRELFHLKWVIWALGLGAWQLLMGLRTETNLIQTKSGEPWVISPKPKKGWRSWGIGWCILLSKPQHSLRLPGGEGHQNCPAKKQEKCCSETCRLRSELSIIKLHNTWNSRKNTPYFKNLTKNNR